MILVYGATGYTGRLVVRTMHEYGLRPVLAGRRREALEAIAGPLGLDVRVGGLKDISVDGATALLNCAGPFSATQPPLLQACIDSGVHYLDLAGEVEEHRTAFAADADARRADALVMPGVGFGIVPSDTLAAHVLARLPHAVGLDLALKTVGSPSRGTAEVVLGNLRTPGVQRENHTLVPARAAARRLTVDFADGDPAATVVTNPWRADLLASVPEVGDLHTYMTFPAPVRALIRIPHGTLLRRIAARLPEGPSDEALRAGRTAVWARATAASAARAAEKIVDGDITPGYHTPSGLWGPDFTVDIPGVTRVDLD